jgi:O-antigen/teichoic acid export membrane protein
VAPPPSALAAVRVNWWLNSAGLLLSFGASVVLVRAVPPELYAQYAAVMAIIGLATFMVDAGANSGLTRYLADAARLEARGTFYRRMQRRRLLGAIAGGVVIVAAGPMYARAAHLTGLTATPWLFMLIAGIVAATLVGAFAHYGLLAVFEPKIALLYQQGFLVLRSVALALIALAGGTLAHLVVGLLAVHALQGFCVDRQLWKLIGTERATLAAAFVNRAQRFGLLAIFDKMCALLGSGMVLLLVLAPQQSAVQMAMLGLAVDLVGKLMSLTAMPMGNMVAPYLSRTSDAAEAQGLAAARVAKLSSLLYSFSVGVGVLLLPWFVSAVYGGGYRDAARLALMLLVPTAFEAWIRGCCSPALLRTGRYRELMRVNVIQAVVTLTVLMLVYRQPLEAAIVAVGVARASVAALNLIAFRQLVPPQSGRVPLQGALVGALACALASVCGRWLPLPAAAAAAIQALLFTLVFYGGLRWLVFRDADTLHLARRIAGQRIKMLDRLLPPSLASPA